MNDYLTISERTQLDYVRGRDSSVDQTLCQVERILASRRFERLQQRAKDFLRFIVVKRLLGQLDQIKETTIAIAVFGESAGDFDPAISSKVRVAASDLRQRLEAYDEEGGWGDDITIRLPLNTYVPAIEDRRVGISITGLDNWHPHRKNAHLSETILAEMIERLTQAGLRAGRPESFQIAASQRQYVLRGSLETPDDSLRVHISLTDPDAGEFLCSRTFEGPRDDVLKLARAISDAVLEPLATVLGKSPRRVHT